jgi:hypothetical protein
MSMWRVLFPARRGDDTFSSFAASVMIALVASLPMPVLAVMRELMQLRRDVQPTSGPRF